MQFGVKRLIALVLWGCSLLCGIAEAASIHLTFYDRNGNAMSGSAALTLMAPPPNGYSSDALVNPTNLQMLVDVPLYTNTDGLNFDLQSQPVALAVNWPTVRGYSTVILDNGGKGFTTAASINFTYQAALDAKAHLDAALAARPDYVRSGCFNPPYQAAVSALAAAASATSASAQGAQGQTALDNIAQAADILLAEYGSTRVHNGMGTLPPLVGFTFDDISSYSTNLPLTQTLAGSNTWVRIVFDKGEPTSYYSAVITKAHSMGIKVMGQPVDSAYDASYTDAQYEQQVEQFVTAFPQVDAWEVGNEVNGSWLSKTIASRVATASAYVKSHTTAKVVLTLYWEMGGDAAQYSMFNWERANLPISVRSNLDIILVSLYIEDAPMGMAFDQVMRQLQSDFPNQQIGLGELGYFESGTTQAWWAMNQTNTTQAREMVAAQYYASVLAFPGSVGGAFWWYFVETFPPDPVIQQSVSNVVKETSGGLAVCSALPPPNACDVNVDNQVNVVDVQLVVNQALGSSTCTADLNQDGHCNIVDVQRTVNAALGKPCQIGP